MGSYCELKFDDISILSHKSYVPDDFICLFQENDRQESPGEDTDSESITVGYFSSREIMLQRLDLLGHTAQRARLHFGNWLKQQQSEYATDDSEELAFALSTFNYEEWLSRAKGVLLTRYNLTRQHDECKDEIDRKMRDPEEDWLFYDGDNILPIIRSFLESFPETSTVLLDISNLVSGGYVTTKEAICESRRIPALHWRSNLQPTVGGVQ